VNPTTKKIVLGEIICCAERERPWHLRKTFLETRKRETALQKNQDAPENG